MKPLLTLFLLVLVSACITQCKSAETPTESLTDKEVMAAQRIYEDLGKPVAFIPFGVNTANYEIYEDGIIPSVNIENYAEDLPRLVMKDMVMIYENTVTILIDYPLNNPYTFTLTSEDGFTRGLLLQEISKHYTYVYTEEERTATVKTLPMEQREMINRNETNGTYGIWGHDLGDLFLAGIHVHKDRDGRTVLLLDIES